MGEFDRFVQEGRDCFLVRYTYVEMKLYVDIVKDDIEKMARTVRERGEDRGEGRTRILASVHHALKSYLLGSPIRGREDATNDVGIWWFYEYLDGRGEQHIEADWRRIVEGGPVDVPKWPKGLFKTSKKRRDS